MPAQNDDDQHRSPRDAIDPDLVEYLVMTTGALSRTTVVARALKDLVEASQIRILDVVGLQVDEGGGYAAVEPEMLSGFAELCVDGECGDLLSEDDITLASSAMDPGSSALLLVAEDGWARPLAEAVRQSGGGIVGGERIPRARIEQTWRRRARRGSGGER